MIPPSSGSPHSRTPPIYHISPSYHPFHLPPPTSYGSHFPSHFYPEKLYQYWHHYYPRIPGGDIQNVGGDQLRLYYQELTKDWTMRCCQTITTGTDPNQNPLNPCSTSLLRLRGHAGEDTTSDSNSFSYLLSCIVGTMCI